METIFTRQEQEMIADNDTLIITDPCYLLREEHWQQWLELEGSKGLSLQQYLHEVLDFGEVIAANTGYGDWSNRVFKTVDGTTVGSFTADAGMVMVCTASDLTNYGYDINEFNRLKSIGCIAVIPDFTGSVMLDYEKVGENGMELAVLYGTVKEEIEGEPGFEDLFDWQTMGWDKENYTP